MAVHGGRLYFTVKEPLQVWSIGINLDGTFADDARWELDVTGLASNNPITDMLFDAEGRMVLAQRGEQRGSYDYTVFAEPLQSSVVRYQRELPDNPATPGTWVPVPDEYAIGFRPDGRNTDGGVALGPSYDANGQMIAGSCGGYLWTTGESLRENPALAAQLAAGGPATVHGLQGNDHNLVRPANDPPFQSYFTDYDGQFDDVDNQGHMGDVEIWQPCQGNSYGGYGYLPPYFPPPPYTPPPADGFNLRLDKQADPKTCAVDPTGYICQFTIRVTNTGPGIFAGPITVDDTLPTVPPTAVVDFDLQPPWVCGALGPISYECTTWAYLFPGESVDLYVTVTLPGDTDLCHLPNVAQLVWGPGWGDSDPSDDSDWDSAVVPSDKCGPPEGDTTNLKIEKRGDPICKDDGAWVCEYSILITNTGPGVYKGDIVIDDTLSVPDPIGAPSPPDWTCTNPGPVHTCTFPEASLPDGVGGGQLDPTNSIILQFSVVVPKVNQEQADACEVTNQAMITQAPGGSPMNINPADDTSALIHSATPGPNCPPVDRHSDLSILKRGLGCFPYHRTLAEGPAGEGPVQLAPSGQSQAQQLVIQGGADGGAVANTQWACIFGIEVHNNGPDDFPGPLTVNDTFIGFTPVPPSPLFGWPTTGAVCTPYGIGGSDCTANIPIAHGTSAPPLWVGVIVPGDGSVCDVTNEATITDPAGGTPQNTNPGNDTSQATLHIPSAQCSQVEAIKICPVQSRMPDGGCCPDGGTWNGRACSNGAPPPPPPPPPPPTGQCPAGMHGTPPNCVTDQCPQGTHGTYPRCEPNVCPRGSVGQWPNCRCPDGTTGVWPRCVKPPVFQPQCRAGTHGTYPNCVPNVCQEGTHGTYPNCIRNVCPQGTVGQWPNCRKLVCPQGTHGTYPNCIRNVCPQGTHGTYPNCIRNVCPNGTIGRWPNCVKPPILQPQCGPGTHGTYPRCLPNVCPKGTIGRWPNCVKAPVLRQPTQPVQPPTLQINPNLKLFVPPPSNQIK